jgi:myo-inositol-1-phosphate synthase
MAARARKRKGARKLGAWLIGARGSVATCAAYGLAGLREGLIEPTGLVTAREPFAGLDLVAWDEIALGGHEVCARRLTQSAGELVRQRVLPADLVTGAAPHAAAYEERVRSGLLDAADVGVGDLDPEAARRGSLPPREALEALSADLAEFQRELELDDVVVVNLASTEAQRAVNGDGADLRSLETALDAGRSQPASVLYAYAALSSGMPFVNFTPSPGASWPALRELAREKSVPHCGNDGKTGETLVKTALAPMFLARHLRVLAWQGYNLLGNRDGEVLADPLHKESKLKSKGDVLRSLLADPDLKAHVGIDYVPSLADWKTAWDFVHFEGFLGARMSLQFTWQGSDSALAAPLVIDLLRLTELAHRRGEVGEMPHTASFFKAPLAGGTHDFHAQYRALLDYAASSAGS